MRLYANWIVPALIVGFAMRLAVVFGEPECVKYHPPQTRAEYLQGLTI